MSEAPRPRLSVCIVAMNEADNIGDCLRSADFADEWIVVDSHSTDDTREIAAELGATVVERDWPGHIEQKNHALSLATHDWVLCLDADERISPELRTSILAALSSGDLPAGFEFNRCTRYMGRWIRHGGWYPDTKLRLFRRAVGRWGGVNPHDHVYVDGKDVRHLRGDLLHHSYRSLSDHLRIIDSYTSIMARDKHAAGKRAGLLDLTVRPFWKFLRMYLVKAGFLDGLPGLVVAVSGAYYVFLKYAKLRELHDAGGRVSDEELTRVQASGLDWVCANGAAAESVREYVAPALDDLESLPGGALIKRNLVRLVVRAELPGLGDVIVKRYAVRGPTDWVKYAFKPSRAEAEWNVGRALHDAGIPTIEPLAMGERRSAVLRDAALVVRTIPDALFLNAYVERAWGDRRDENRARLFLGIARTVRRMHDAGFVHHDLHGGNVLVSGTPENAAHHVIDLHSVTRSDAPGDRARWGDLLKLLHAIRLCTTRDERVAMCRAYEEEGGRPSGSRVARLLADGTLLTVLEPRIAAMEEKRVRSRTARALGRSSRFDVSSCPPYGVHHLRSIPAHAFVPLVGEHRRTVSEGGRGVLKDARRSALTRQTLRLRDVERPVVVKEYRFRGVLARLKNAVRTPRDVAAWFAGYGLIVRGFAAAEPLALLRQGRGPLLSGSFLIMEDLGDASRLDLVTLARFAGPLDPSGRADKRRLLAVMAALFRALHAGRVYHADLKAVNLFVRETGAGPEIVMADYDRVDFDADVTLRRRMKNLAQLSASIPICISVSDRLRFFRDYARDEPLLLADWKACFRAVIDLCRQKIVVRMEPIE